MLFEMKALQVTIKKTLVIRSKNYGIGVKKKSQNRKASKASSGRSKANLKLMERKKAADVDPYGTH